ncbi:MAG TPA: FAD-binding oxidoreductase, partial [Acetobacteraceae bacterium]|nr:FAD-binding oxidoreductase [Acetobacteraceae bacterium]
PPLDGDRRVGIAVIGGGFTGLSTALHLAEGGAEVAVIEAREPGWGASGRNGGQVNPGLKHDPDQVEADFGPELGSRMVAMSGAAPDVVFELVRRYQIDCAARQSGTLRAAFGQRAAAGIRRSTAQWTRRGKPVTLLERGEIAAATGSRRYLCAMLDRRGGQVNPLGYARGLAQAAQQAGAAVHGGTPATRVRRDGHDWVVETPTGTLRADTVVLATNAYSDGLWPGLARSVVPVFSGIVASEPLSDDLARAVMPTRSVLYEMGSVTVYYRLDERNRLLMGGRCPLRDIAAPAELSHLSGYALRLWPELRGLRWTHAWSGQLAVTPDHYPHVHEPVPGVIACLGYNGRGVAMSTAMGRQLAHRILTGRAIDMPITTMKAIRFHALWRSAVAARVTYGRIADWLRL